MKKILTTIHRFLRERPAFEWLFVGVLMATYVGLSLWHLTAGSIWFDEAFSSYIIQFNPVEIAKYTAADVHPPFYYWLLKGWAAIFGHGEVGLRSMSIFFGVIAAGFAYAWARRSFGKKAALSGLAILVLSPLFIRYSQEARMYTLAAALVFAATYTLSVALEQKKQSHWIVYGVLVSLGMLTHYFTALAWIAHWVWRFVPLWRKGLRGKKLRTTFFSKEWVIAYGVAVGLFLPWLPFMAFQLLVIQTQGFWIGPVGVDTFGSYFGTLVYFWKSNQITGWLAVLLVAMGAVVVAASIRTYRRLRKQERQSFGLLLSLAAVPPLLLFIASLPPLTSSFVERYLLPAAMASAFFSGLVLTVGLRGEKIWKQATVVIIMIAMLVFGLTNMYFYGNYNKNSGTDIKTRQVVELAIERADPGVPIIAKDPWVFYEAVFYNSDDHPIYFLDESTHYEFGSLDMLKLNDEHKIKDLDAFLREHPVVWYIGNSSGELTAPRSSLTILDRVSATSSVDGQTVYKGIKVTTR